MYSCNDRVKMTDQGSGARDSTSRDGAARGSARAGDRAAAHRLGAHRTAPPRRTRSAGTAPARAPSPPPRTNALRTDSPAVNLENLYRPISFLFQYLPKIKLDVFQSHYPKL